jgi:hypothetical protein
MLELAPSTVPTARSIALAVASEVPPVPLARAGSMIELRDAAERSPAQ